MSALARQALAAAASTVDGVDVSPWFRQTTKPGAGMVRLERWTRSENGFGGVNTWQVWVTLPQDLATAEKWIDEHVSELVEALSPQMVVTSVTPQQLALDTGSVPIVVIEGSREQE